MDNEHLRYLSQQDVQKLKLSVASLCDVIADLLVAQRKGAAWRNPNSTISLCSGTRTISFHAAALNPPYSVHKTLGLSSSNAERGLPHMGGLINVHDVNTGHPVAILDCEELTGLRTAALSLLAARYLAPKGARRIGFIGTGRQAKFHLTGFLSEYDLKQAILFQPRGRDCNRFIEICCSAGLNTILHQDWQNVLSASDILITSLPDGPGFAPFLDAAYLPNSSFVAAVDAGRSWLPEHLASFDPLIVDDLVLHADNPFVTGSEPTSDLEGLVSGECTLPPTQKAGFFFAGLALADLAVAGLALKQAQTLNVGIILPR